MCTCKMRLSCFGLLWIVKELSTNERDVCVLYETTYENDIIIRYDIICIYLHIDFDILAQYLELTFSNNTE